MPAGGEPEERAKMVSVTASPYTVPRETSVLRLLGTRPCHCAKTALVHEVLEQLQSDLAHWRDLLGKALQLVEAARPLHRLGDAFDVDVVRFRNIRQAEETAGFFGRAIDFDGDFHVRPFRHPLVGGDCHARLAKSTAGANMAFDQLL